MTTAEENAYCFISVLQKLIELNEEAGDNKVLLEDVKMLLRHFELNSSAGDG